MFFVDFLTSTSKMLPEALLLLLFISFELCLVTLTAGFSSKRQSVLRWGPLRRLFLMLELTASEAVAFLNLCCLHLRLFSTSTDDVLASRRKQIHMKLSISIELPASKLVIMWFVSQAYMFPLQHSVLVRAPPTYPLCMAPVFSLRNCLVQFHSKVVQYKCRKTRNCMD